MSPEGDSWHSFNAKGRAAAAPVDALPGPGERAPPQEERSDDFKYGHYSSKPLVTLFGQPAACAFQTYGHRAL
jgi:hypothetical protein